MRKLGVTFFAAGDVVPIGTFRAGRPEYALTRDLVFRWPTERSAVTVTVPAGYITDLHSLPGVFRLWQPKHCKWWGPAILHDWLYDAGRGWPEKLMADFLYLIAMAVCGVRSWHYVPAFVAVLFGGWAGFGKPLPHNRASVEAHAARARDPIVPRLSTAAHVLKTVNAHRASHGLPPLETLTHD